MNKISWAKLQKQVALVSFMPALCSMLACNAAQDESQDESTNKPQTPEMAAVGQSLAFGGHDYLFVTTPKNWYDARILCMNQGYQLVSTDTPAEEAFLNDQETRIGLQYWWIGFNDIAREGAWVWEGPSSITPYTNWTSGEPNNGGGYEDCAIDGWSNGQWNDAGCDSLYPFICEKNPASQNQGSFSYSLSNTSSATTNTYDYSIYLSADRILTVGTCGLDGASGNGDTYLRLIGPSGQEIASNDDAGGSCKSLSNFSIVIPSPGKYNIRAGCFSGSSCSGTVVFTY
jgi:hypothetical protein